MPEPEAVSPLLSTLDHAPARFSDTGLSFEERPFVVKLAIRGRADDRAFFERFAKVFGVTPPRTGRSAAAGGALVISVGPREWLAVGAHASAGPLLSPTLIRLAAAGIIFVDVSSATTILRISGSRCFATLHRLCTLPLDRLVAGDAARTRIGRLAILVHALGQDRFDLFVPRSYARSSFDQLRDSAELQR